MQTPEPVREHRVLEKLAGHFAGPEKMHPSYWNAEPKNAEAVTDGRVALDGFAVVQDYEQRLEDGTRFAGHGVFRYDMTSETYEMHWFDSTGGPERVFRGGFSDNRLVLTARTGEGWQRLTYDFNLDRGYRFTLDTSDDGERWNLVLEGDNIAGRKAPAGKATARKKKAVAGSGTARKAAPKKAAPKKKATARKTAARKTAARKATPKKTSPKRKAAAKTAARRVAKKKTATRKVAAKKAAPKKTAKKASGRRKVAAKKTAAGKKTASTKKATAKKTVATIEKQRRQGKASRKIGKKSHPRGDGAAARAPVSQKRTKGAAHKGPRMPTLKSTSTRVGWHKTAAKGR